MDKFAGVGLKNVFLIWILCIIFTLMFRVIMVKYPVDGLKEVAMAV